MRLRNAIRGPWSPALRKGWIPQGCVRKISTPLAPEDRLSETLYLDTARLGLMSPTAQRLHNSFARFAGDPHGLLYFRDFLSHGNEGCPSACPTKLLGLDAWRGLSGLTRSIRILTGAPSRAEVLFASRSATLMSLAAQRLASVCQRILTVDLLWPPYRRILSEACRLARVPTVVCPVRTASLLKEDSCDQLAARIREAVVHHDCDGLVLPLVDHRGVTLPVDAITRCLRDHGQVPKYVVVDGSQALGHVPINLQTLGCHFFVGGAHKWVGGYHPLGIGVTAEPSPTGIASLAAADPLLRLTHEAIGTVSARHGETAAILPLLTAAGAIADLDGAPVERSLRVRRANRKRLSEFMKTAGWRPVRAHAERHGILLARPPSTGRLLGDRIDCQPFVERGVAVTAYANGLVRFSLPRVPFTGQDMNQLSAALGAFSPACS